MFNWFRNKYTIKTLNNLNPESVNLFSFDGISTLARVVDVYDGDTITFIFIHKGTPIKYKCRVFGIDTPEIRTKDLEEKKLGYEAKDYLKSYIFDKIIKVDLYHFDKYGRLLAKIYAPVGGTYIDIGQDMINKGYARPYFGGTKKNINLNLKLKKLNNWKVKKKI